MFTATEIQEIASVIVGHEVILSAPQLEYTVIMFNQLPEWCQKALTSGIPSDTHLKIARKRKEEALAIARELFNTTVLTLSERPISELLELSGMQLDGLSYDGIVATICYKEMDKINVDCYPDEAILTGFRSRLCEPASTAIQDAYKLLARKAYTSELTSFRRAITKRFPLTAKSYRHAINSALSVARNDAIGKGHHYASTVEETIGAFQTSLRDMHCSNTRLARRTLLIQDLPLDADNSDLGWALGIDSTTGLSGLPINDAKVRRSLLSAGLTTVGEMLNWPVLDGSADPIDNAIIETKQWLDSNI
ncbi:hypothetical protein IJ847_00660 [Candidatus Saccharibacteria bacterium]|nr:hypothetical protein [Candidatus Saccharibacteria bacterium]